MTDNNKTLVSAGHELASELKADCGAVDVRSVANLLTELASALDVQSARSDALEAELKKAEANDADARCHVAELEARCEALAAELSAIENIHNDAVFITDDHYEQCPMEVKKIIRSLAVMQIPSYKAFLAEVRAQGVEMFAASERKLVAKHASTIDTSSVEYGAARADDFAAQLRGNADGGAL